MPSWRTQSLTVKIRGSFCITPGSLRASGHEGEVTQPGLYLLDEYCTCIGAIRTGIRTGAVHSAVLGRPRYDPKSRDPSVDFVFAVAGERDRVDVFGVWISEVDLWADPLEVAGARFNTL